MKKEILAAMAQKGYTPEQIIFICSESGRRYKWDAFCKLIESGPPEEDITITFAGRYSILILNGNICP